MAANETPTIFIAGHRGMAGSALHRRLLQAGTNQILTASRKDLDLLDQAAVDAFFGRHSIDIVYLAAARVGGIHANDTYPADFLYQNLLIQTNVIGAAHRHGVNRLLFLGSSCIYPRLAAQPMAETALLTGKLEPTNEPYAIAKIAGIKLCESFRRQHGRDYRSVMPTNLYGPGDNFHPENSHVIPALMRRIHEAKVSKSPEVTIWGTGTPMREFLHVDDFAAAAVHIMELDAAAYWTEGTTMCSHINVGTGQDVSIAEFAHVLARVIGYQGALRFDSSKPDGAPRKLLDISRLKLSGWEPSIGLEAGLRATYQWFLAHESALRAD